MNKDIIKAKEVLIKEKATCVFCKNDDIVISEEHGVKPLISLIESKKNYKDYSAADKVIGNGAAFLFAMLGVKEVFAEVISEAACNTLKRYGIEYSYDNKAAYIQNREGNGVCPMEQAVANAENPEDALVLINKKIAWLKVTKKQK
ncbi:MAG: DUF1893 domain-containing protein [Clostridia bacterium]|nr:DUF1893 domain-containing protein [Clostridia bacterium]